MKRTTACVLALGLAASGAHAQDAPAPAAGAAKVLILEHVALIDGRSDAVRPDMTIVIRGTEIAEVLPSVPASVPDSAFVLDLAGCWVMPGLIDSHVHISHDSRRATEDALQRALLGGVTTVRDMGGDARRLASLQRDALLGDIPSPDIFYSAVFAGPAFFTDPRVVDVTRGATSGETPWARAVRPETNLDEAVLEAKGAGATAIKIYADLPPAELARISTAAHARGLRVWSHAAVFPSRPADALAAGIDVISHASLLYWQTTRDVPPAYGPHRDFPPPGPAAASSPALKTLFADMKARGTILDATLYVGQYLAKTTTEAARRKYWRAFQEFSCAAVRAAHAAGVRIDAGTDSMIEDGEDLPNLHEELRLLVDAGGLSPMEAIQAATRVGADVLGAGDRAGTVEPGRRANLVVLAADPTARIANTRSIRFVVKGGRLFVRP
jgi:imidazolonepropionase-like amidohydrolase